MPFEKKRVFLSFAAEDREQVQGLRLLAANPNYDLEFYDESVRSPIESTNPEYIKRVIRDKISRTSVTVCLISEHTHKSQWVEWELEESHTKDHKIIAMALKGISQAHLPPLIKKLAVRFWNWDPEYLNKLIAEV
jgi:hypothetical protein